MTARFRIDQLLDHDRSTFSSGVEPLGQCLRRQASQDIKRKLSVCYLATEVTTGRLAGYYTLSASIALADLPLASCRAIRPFRQRGSAASRSTGRFAVGSDTAGLDP